MNEKLIFDEHLMEGFVKAFLLDSFDNARPIAGFHRECWRMVTSGERKVAIAAPREHAKSTAITFCYVLAALLFRQAEFPVLISKTYTIAVEFVRTLKDTLLTNEKIQRSFKFKRLVKDSENDFIAEFEGGHQIRVMGAGMDQPIRGLKWGSKRPDLVMLDDVEDDEEVLSDDRREKALNKFLSAIMPSGSSKTKYRIVGTVLHIDSLLENLLNDATWMSRRYEAHDDNFKNILWPEMFDEKRLKDIRDGFASHGKLDKYNMEYRNRPTDRSAALFREEDFVGMNDSDRLAVRENDWPIAVGGDFAISVKARRDFTVFIVGVLGPDGVLYIVDCIRERMGEQDHEAEGVVTRMFEIEDIYRNWTKGRPLQWFEEDGSIRKALGYALELEMQMRDVYLNLCPQSPGTTDKRMRSMPIRGRMRAKMVKFDTETEWFHNLQNECLEFDRGKHDDQVDALSWLGIGISTMTRPADDAELEEEEFTLRRRHVSRAGGRNRVTGY